MQLLAIDFGLRKVGLAMSEGKLAEPLMVVRYTSEDELVRRIKRIVKEKNIERIIVGVSEGRMAEKSREFGEKLKDFVDIAFADETLTTKDAISMAIKAGVRKEKRKKFEDAFAAAVMLQNYIDALS